MTTYVGVLSQIRPACGTGFLPEYVAVSHSAAAARVRPALGCRANSHDNSTVTQDPTPKERAPSLLRLAAAMVYDGLALLAIWFFATLVIVVVRRGTAIDAGNPLFTLYLALTAYAYFGYCWGRTGQTLGMKSWRFRLVSGAGPGPITWQQTALRFLGAIVSVAACGLGYVWALFDRNGYTWHDRLSRTYLRNAD